MNKKEMRSIAREYIERNFSFTQGDEVNVVMTPDNETFGKVVKSELKKLGAKVTLTIQEAEQTENVNDDGIILEVRNLKKHFVLKKTLMGEPLSTLKAVDNVSFTIKEGETLGIVGESGCGKTTMGRAVLKLHQPTGGQIIFEGKDITTYSPKQMRALRTKMQIVFQDPYSSLPPRSTVGDILSEPVRVHKIVPPSQVKEYVLGDGRTDRLSVYYL